MEHAVDEDIDDEPEIVSQQTYLQNKEMPQAAAPITGGDYWAVVDALLARNRNDIINALMVKPARVENSLIAKIQTERVIREAEIKRVGEKLEAKLDEPINGSQQSGTRDVTQGAPTTTSGAWQASRIVMGGWPKLTPWIDVEKRG